MKVEHVSWDQFAAVNPLVKEQWMICWVFYHVNIDQNERIVLEFFLSLLDQSNIIDVGEDWGYDEHDWENVVFLTQPQNYGIKLKYLKRTQNFGYKQIKFGSYGHFDEIWTEVSFEEVTLLVC